MDGVPAFQLPPCSLNLVLSDYLTNKFVSLIRLGFHPLSYYAPASYVASARNEKLPPRNRPQYALRCDKRERNNLKKDKIKDKKTKKIEDFITFRYIIMQINVYSLL